jgi:hypothetical protein
MEKEMSNNPVSEFLQRQDQDKEHKFEQGEITLDDVASVLSLTIKDDDSNKKIVFLCMLSAFTEDSQINVSLNAPSATGKTYLATEIAKLFPEEDKLELSGASPTALLYGKKEVDEVTGEQFVNLERKILLFLEMPNPSLQEKLRALMSHDDKNLKYLMTNKQKGRNVTDEIILRGFSATIFCSAGLRLDEQEATRAILLSPESSPEKILQGIGMRVKRSANAQKFHNTIKHNYDRQMLMARIIAIRNAKIDNIIIPNEEDIESRFLKIVGVLKPRHQRDVSHLMEIIKAITLLNVWHRKSDTGAVVASQGDIDEGFKLWQDFFESQNLNVSPVVLKYYKKYILPAYLDKFAKSNKGTKELWEEMRQHRIGLTPQELNVYYRDQEGTSLNGEQLRKQVLPQLEGSGLIEWETPQGDVDKRTKHIFPMSLTDENKKYIGTYGVVNRKLSDEW